MNEPGFAIVVVDCCNQCPCSSDVYRIKVFLRVAANRARAVNDSGCAGDKYLQCGCIGKVSLNESNAKVFEELCFAGRTHQRSNREATFNQALAENGTDKPGGAGDANDLAVRYQAEAAMTRSSCAAAFRSSILWVLMKSRRALALDNLPDDVRGSERLGTSCT